jgi:hypothetical protein
MTPLEVSSVERFGSEELLRRLRATRLRDGTPVYADATLEVATAVDPESLAPAQRYVLRGGVARILELRERLLEHGVDSFALDGGAYVAASDRPGERLPVIPPIVEESHEPDGRTVLVINDGIHRVYAARSLGLPITVVVVRGVPVQYPYYAFALPDGWAGVTELDELPDGFVKKAYRRPESYRSLFREFNDVFPGVQTARKRSNPSHLAA